MVYLDTAVVIYLFCSLNFSLLLGIFKRLCLSLLVPQYLQVHCEVVLELKKQPNNIFLCPGFVESRNLQKLGLKLNFNISFHLCMKRLLVLIETVYFIFHDGQNAFVFLCWLCH